MPFADVNGIRLHYEDSGSGPETIVFAHAGLFDRRMWEAQVEEFRDSYRCITYDHRGQGQSGVPPEVAIDHDVLAEDAAALIQHLSAAPCHFVGLSQGANVGVRLALRRPELLTSLVVLGLTVDQDERFVRRFTLLATLLRFVGPRLVLPRVMPVMFGKHFMDDAVRKEQRDLWRSRLQANQRAIHKTARGIAGRTPLADELSHVDVPTLVISGEEDEVSSPAKARAIHEQLPHSELVLVPRSGHMTALEQPRGVNDAIRAFLSSVGPARR